MLIAFIAIIFMPASSASSAQTRNDVDVSAKVIPKEIGTVPFVAASETEASFDLVRTGPRFDPPWTTEDTLGDNISDDESPSLALNGNGTYLAMWQIKNGSGHDVGYLLASRGNAWGGGYIKNTTFDARNISVAAFDDGRFMGIAEDWTNRTRLVRFVTSDEGSSWKIFFSNMQAGAGGHKYIEVANPMIVAGNNKTLGDTLFGSFDVVTDASPIKTIGMLDSPSGGKTGISYSHFINQTTDMKNPRSSLSKSKSTGFMRGYITAEFTNGTNTDAVLLHNNLPPQGMWAFRLYSPASASWEADPNIPSDGSNVLWVMRSGSQANGNIVSMKSTDDAKTFGTVVNVANAATNEQYPSAAITDNVAWVAYADGTPNGNWRAANSTDGGGTWGTTNKVMSTSGTLVAYSGTGELAFTGGMPGTVWTDSRQSGQGRNVYFSGTKDGYAPFVSWTDPSNGTINVTTFTKPIILFSDAMNGTATEPAISFNPTFNLTYQWPSYSELKVFPEIPFEVLARNTRSR